MSGGILRVTSSYFGIVGDGKTFETKGIANLQSALADADIIELTDRPQMLLGETLTLSGLDTKTLTTGRVPSMRTRESWPGFLWDGPKGGTMIVLDRCRELTLDGFGIQTDDFERVKAPAGMGILLDGGQDTHPESSAIGTACTLSRLRHLTWPDPAGSAPLDVEADFIGIALTTKMNQEFHTITQCGGNGNGRGRFLYQGPSYNAKNTIVEGSRYIDAYRRGIQLDNGSVKLAHNNMSLNEWDLWLAASTGYVTEEHHIGEGSTHHAFINCPFAVFDGTYDNSRTRPRSVPVTGLPSYPDEVGLTYEEAWIHFGGFAADVSLTPCTIGPPPDPNTKVFGWMNDRSMARYELGPFWLAYGHTKRTLGIDTPTLRKIAGRPKISFHNRAAGNNPNGPGPADLPGGELVLNSSGTAYVP